MPTPDRAVDSPQIPMPGMPDPPTITRIHGSGSIAPGQVVEYQGRIIGGPRFGLRGKGGAHSRPPSRRGHGPSRNLAHSLPLPHAAKSRLRFTGLLSNRHSRARRLAPYSDTGRESRGGAWFPPKQYPDYELTSLPTYQRRITDVQKMV